MKVAQRPGKGTELRKGKLSRARDWRAKVIAEQVT